MSRRPAKEELEQLADFQRRHRSSLLCMVCTEVDGVARLKQQLGDAEAIRLLGLHEHVLRDLLSGFPGGVEIGSGNGSFLLVFDKPSDAVKFASELQSRILLLSKKVGQNLRERIGIHVGEVLVEHPDGETRMRSLNGIHVDICQTVLSLAGPGQVLLTRFAHDSSRQALKSTPDSGIPDLVWANHGAYRIQDADETVDICEVAHRSRLPLLPPPGNDRIKRLHPASALDSIPASDPNSSLPRVLRLATRQEHRSAAVGAAVVAVLGMLCLVFRWLDGPSYDWSYAIHSTKTVEDVVIIGIDDTSIGTLAEGRNRSLATWDRSLHTRLLNRMTEAGARLVVFDVLFEDPKGAVLTNGFVESTTDRDFRTALEKSGRTVLAARWVGDPDKVIAPSPLFRKPGAWGLVEQSENSSTAIRQPITTQRDVPPIGELLVTAGWGRTSSTPHNAWLRYYGPPGTIRMLPFLSALSPDEVPSAVISNKVVFVGGASRVVPDRDAFPSPYSRWRSADINGVEVNATRFLNQLRNDWLRRLPAWVELAAVVLFGSIGAYLLVFLPPGRSTAIGLAIAITLGLALAAQVWATGVWFPWLIITAVQGPAAVLWAVVVRSRWTWEQDRQIRKALETHRQKPEYIQATQAAAQEATIRVNPAHARPKATPAAPAQSQIPQIPDHQMIRCIGKGAYGEVWIALDIIGKYKAVKTIRRDAFEDQAPFEREFRGLQKFTPISRSHPGLVHILHIGRNDSDGFIYYIMEIGDDVTRGQDIVPATYQAHSLGSDLESNGPIPLKTLLQHGMEIAEALAHLHRHQLVHRDLKPSNIIFVNGRTKLADIGLVTDIVSQGQEITYVGTHGYMPPEGHGTPTADIYSLGRLLYVGAAARPVQHFPDVPPAVREAAGGEIFDEFLGVLLRACEPFPAARYQDADELLTHLRGLHARIPVSPQNDPEAPPAQD